MERILVKTFSQNIVRTQHSESLHLSHIYIQISEHVIFTSATWHFDIVVEKDRHIYCICLSPPPPLGNVLISPVMAAFLKQNYTSRDLILDPQCPT